MWSWYVWDKLFSLLYVRVNLLACIRAWEPMKKIKILFGEEIEILRCVCIYFIFIFYLLILLFFVITGLSVMCFCVWKFVYLWICVCDFLFCLCLYMCTDWKELIFLCMRLIMCLWVCEGVCNSHVSHQLILVLSLYQGWRSALFSGYFCLLPTAITYFPWHL